MATGPHAADKDYARRLRWFHEARFGMFIHFGLYSMLQRGEWTMFHERIRPADYARLARQFEPGHFDANAWADLAHEAGMKYMVLTARHGDGFCLFDSQVSDFTSVKTAAKRDFVAAYVEACRNAGLRVGLYYSLLDWRFPGYFEPEKHPKSAHALVQQAHDQVRELMSNYGPIDELWYDGDWIGQLGGDGPQRDIAAFWRARELNAMVRRLQPQILINNRCGLSEDLDTPEQNIRASAPGRGWEACMTIGDAAWGYVKHSAAPKSVPQLLQNLCVTAAGEGNFLLNVGPKPDGTIRKAETKRLLEIGAWLKAHGEAIYGSQRCDLYGRNDAFAHVGVWTRRGNAAYLHVFRWPSGVNPSLRAKGPAITIPLVKTRVRSAELLATGQRLRVRQEYNGRLVLSGLPEDPPDPCVNTIKVRFAGVPESLREMDKSGWLEGKAR
jgi:alpha-L-fucosidase